MSISAVKFRKMPNQAGGDTRTIVQAVPRFEFLTRRVVLAGFTPSAVVQPNLNRTKHRLIRLEERGQVYFWRNSMPKTDTIRTSTMTPVAWVCRHIGFMARLPRLDLPGIPQHISGVTIASPAFSMTPTGSVICICSAMRAAHA